MLFLIDFFLLLFSGCVCVCVRTAAAGEIACMIGKRELKKREKHTHSSFPPRTKPERMSCYANPVHFVIDQNYGSHSSLAVKRRGILPMYF